VAGLGQDDTLTLLTKDRGAGRPRPGPAGSSPRESSSRASSSRLREMGCGYGQGFLVARPMGASGVEALIRTSGESPETPKRLGM